MKNLFKHASSSWVRYNRYEWKQDRNNKYYITPGPNAVPQICDPLKDYKAVVLDALNVKKSTGTKSNVVSAGCDIPSAPPVMQLRSEDFKKSSPLRSTTYIRTAGFC